MSKIYFLIITFIIIVDYQTKIYINELINLKDFYEVNEFITFSIVFNKGLIFGIGHTDSILFKNIILFSIFIVLLIIMYYFISNKKKFF